MKWQNHVTVLGIIAFCIGCILLTYDVHDHKLLLKLGLDLRSGSRITVKLIPTPNPITHKMVNITPDVQRRSIQVFQKRLNPDGTKEVVINAEGSDRLVIELPGQTDLAKAEEEVKKAGRLEFKEKVYDPSTDTTKWKTVMDGSYISRATPEPGPGNGQNWQITFELNSAGTKLFGDLTRRLVGKPLGIFYDGAKVSAPTVDEPITGGQGVIQGNFTRAKAVDLANFLNAGALPVNASILESYTVSPTLGHVSVVTSLHAAIGGLLIVMIYMIFYYRVPGAVASAALAVYALAVLASMNIPGLRFVLTLPGIAGFILSIGMAVDANVLIFERLREELWKDKSLSLAVEVGFEKAWPSILDGHVTTFIGAAILYWLGSASIKGFGLTLMLGTGWSMITAIFVTRHFLTFVKDTLGVTGRGLYGA